MTYVNWEQGKPDCLGGIGGGESCLMLYPGGKFNDVSCYQQAYYICQYTGDVVIND